MRIIDNEIEEKKPQLMSLLDIVKGPDFPTGGIFSEQVESTKLTEQAAAKLRVRAVTNIEPMKMERTELL